MYKETGDLRPQFSHNVLSWQPYFQALLLWLFTTCADLCTTHRNTEWGSSTQNPVTKGNCNILFELQKNNPGHHSLVGHAPLLLICHAKHATEFLILDYALQGNIKHIQRSLDQHLHFYKYWKEKLPTQFSGNTCKSWKKQLLYHWQTESTLYCIYEQKN